MVFQFGHYAAQTTVLVVGQEGELWPLLHEIPIGVDGVRLRQLLLYQGDDRLQVLLGLEGPKFNLRNIYIFAFLLILYIRFHAINK